MASGAMRPSLLAAALLGLLTAPPGAGAAGPLGRFLAYLDRFYMCPDHEEQTTKALVMYIAATRFDKRQPYALQRLTGNVTVSDLVDDSYWAHVRMDARWNAEWKQNAMVFNFPSQACSALADNMPDFFRAAYGQARKPCVILPDFYNIDSTVNWTLPKIPVLPYGHFRLRLMFGQKKEKKMCCYWEAHIIPRPK